MKKLKVRFLVLTFILVLLLFLFDSVKTFAATDGLEIETTANKQSYDLQDEILVKIKTNKKVMTASFYLNYDSSIISYDTYVLFIGISLSNSLVIPKHVYHESYICTITSYCSSNFTPILRVLNSTQSLYAISLSFSIQSMEFLLRKS